jgi:peptidoglycan/xylan/chitin deacetylase (PgdA/CDA1 family)
MDKGNFIISLDFELHWGGVEKWDLQKKRKYFTDTLHFIPELLEIFNKNSIRSTWATVGFLFAYDKKQLLDFSPKLLPSYGRKELSSYNIFESVGDNERVDLFHFAPKLIKDIINTPGQELASHTFSHYYCNEPGQTLEQFDADLKAAQAIAKENFGIILQSLVFPRNQFNKSYLQVARKNGIIAVRSNPNVWFWDTNYGKLTPIFRALDTLMPISKSVSFSKIQEENGLFCVPASRFFRPYKHSEEKIQKLKLSRIKGEMSHAAKKNKNYHLWWHPHNSGEDVENNKKQLLEIIAHYKFLKEKYNFSSANMLDLAKQ